MHVSSSTVRVDMQWRSFGETSLHISCWCRLRRHYHRVCVCTCVCVLYVMEWNRLSQVELNKLSCIFAYHIYFKTFYSFREHCTMHTQKKKIAAATACTKFAAFTVQKKTASIWQKMHSIISFSVGVVVFVVMRMQGNHIVSPPKQQMFARFRKLLTNFLL